MTGKILAVDDEPEILEILEARLIANGYQVIKSKNGLEAIKEINEAIPALVLLDVAMPGADGFQVLKILRSAPKTAGVPVIMLTANGDPQTIMKAREMKATDCLIKPFQAGELLKMIERHL